MELTYIYHSGFALECEKCIIVFDFWKDFSNVENQILKSPKPLYVLCSHAHPDHFNVDVLQWKNLRANVTYVFSKDILKSHKANAEDAVFLRRYENFEDENVRIQTFGSTDVGVSFAVNVDDKTIFHAGDLNNWHWCEESTEQEIRKATGDFLHEIKVICELYKSFDLAMFPIDARMGKNYFLGAEQFVKAIKIKNFAPMHFGENYKSIDAFESVANANNTRFLKIEKCGEKFDIN